MSIGRWHERTQISGDGSPPFRQNVAVLFSHETRQAYIDEARARGETYRFTSATDEEREWIKGQFAYLAPNAATNLLHRYNIKHDVVSEQELTASALAQYEALVVPNAGHLSHETIASIETWLREQGDRSRMLVVTGRTNLPPVLLGLEAYDIIEPGGYTGWGFTEESAFGDTSIWEEYVLSGYKGHKVSKASAGANGSVLAELWEFSGDTTSADQATKRYLGDGIVATDHTLYIANQVLEYMGGAFQSHYNVEDARRWYHPTHYLDTIGFVLRELLQRNGLADLFETQLRSFGDYEGAVVFRHDTDTKPGEALDLSMLDWQIDNAVPATYVILDPEVSSENTTHTVSQSWIERGRTASYIELGLHNDGQIGSPPTYVQGKSMCQHFLDADARLGITTRTAGRHFGFHMHPETLDAMEYLYDQAPAIVGLCTFSVLQVIEYGKYDPNVTRLGRPITYSTAYATDEWTCGAVPGWWFPFHVAVTTTDRYHVLRGWDSTKESECDFDRIDGLLAGQNSKDPRVASRLPNGVYTVQYHPQDARGRKKNDGRGSLEWVKYLATLAERHRFWLATKEMVYDRLNDYQDIRFRVEADGAISVHNPTDRQISGLMLRTSSPIRVVAIDGCTQLCIHVSSDNTVTLPPIAPGHTLRLRPTGDINGVPVLNQSNTKHLAVVSALYDREVGRTHLELSAVGRNNVRFANLDPGASYRITTGGIHTRSWDQRADPDGMIEFSVHAPEKMFTPISVEVSHA